MNKKQKEKHKQKIHLIFGLSIFTILGYMIFYLIISQGDYPPWLHGFANLNDTFTSALFLFCLLVNIKFYKKTEGKLIF